MKTHPMPMDRCLKCDTLFDEATQASRGARGGPKPGDATICLHCGHIMMFDKNRRVRELTGEEMIQVAGDIRIVEIEFFRNMVMQERGKKK
jgi:hypothetical protein